MTADVDALRGLLDRITPGPWTHEGPDDFGDYTISGPTEKLAIAAVCNGGVREFLGEGDLMLANATLIAMAPTLAADNIRLRAALEQINAASVPDQPATSDVPEHIYVRRHVAYLRGMASTALSTQEPKT